MTNGEKFKTVKERTIAFRKFCTNKICKGWNANCILSDKIHDFSGHMCQFAWLDLEYKEDLKPCPFCGGKAMKRKINRLYYVFCKNCSVKTVDSITLDGAIEAWNRRV